ncbi:hypothetical protein K4L06_01020 [Lysobacter sp. BMK333-48F3]|uniref:hypothetical protein n=1 Tax=Lysobacter sp. BMK333-48F3 TaxID=2867962 RepID=UPI001C8CA256|nr:hypothetical protein [Lysobacter sp. BMK333-48F3]MBX9399875.1 hypothetical protein [Lysobacter sp. BMK333-48F3]
MARVSERIKKSIRQFPQAFRVRIAHVEAAIDGRFRKKKFLPLAPVDFASHKPICAKVRERFLAASATPTRRARRVRAQTADRARRENPVALAPAARRRRPPRGSRRRRGETENPCK